MRKSKYTSGPVRKHRFQPGPVRKNRYLAGDETEREANEIMAQVKAQRDYDRKQRKAQRDPETREDRQDDLGESPDY